MKTIPPCRISLVFAQEAPIVVVLRRGPTQWTEVIEWNTKSDEFKHGQWLHGHIYGERCGLSPNGKLFVYFAMKYGGINTEQGYERTFTAVSHPPYLTALAMWPEGTTWGGGGRFVDNKTLRLAYGKGRTYHPGMGPTEIYMAPLPPYHPFHPPSGLVIETNLDYYDPDRSFRGDKKEYPDSDWAGVDHAGKIILIRAGKLYRLGTKRMGVMLKDFNNDKVQEIQSPPWAKLW